jgi:hypothetical protein
MPAYTEGQLITIGWNLWNIKFEDFQTRFARMWEAGEFHLRS